MSDGDFLSRWSRRKLAARRGEAVPERPAAVPPPAPPAPVADAPLTSEQAAGAAPELPPLESLTADSDFSPFMRPDVDPTLRRQALKTLLRDERFNVMDGLDVYIDDYSKPDPLPEGWLEKMNQVARLGEYQPPRPAEAETAEVSGIPDAASPAPPTVPDDPSPEPVAEPSAASQHVDSEGDRGGI